jgi:hypothetical protein
MTGSRIGAGMQVRGAASAEELAAVLAAVARLRGGRSDDAVEVTGLRAWRTRRVAALRRITREDTPRR